MSIILKYRLNGLQNVFLGHSRIMKRVLIKSSQRSMHSGAPEDGATNDLFSLEEVAARAVAVRDKK